MLKDDQLVYIVLELLIALLAVAGNVLVCWAVFLNSNLQSITNFFVVSLAVADIAVGLLAIPFAITISTGFCANFFGCLFIACFVLVLTQNSIFSLLAIAVDRYIAIKNPLRYNSLVTGSRAKGIIGLCWVLSTCIGLMPMIGWNNGLNTTNTNSSDGCPEGLTVCLFEKVVNMDYMIYFNFFGCVLVPLIIMMVIYLNIFMAARRQLRLIGLKVSNLPAPGDITPSSSTSRSTLQKEVHAAKSLAIIVGLFALCWLPLHIINTYNHLCEEDRRSHDLLMYIAIILSHANSVVNPLIYAYRIREFRQTFRRILYQHILRRRDGHVFSIGSDSRSCVGSTSIIRTSSDVSKENLSCGTVVNSYVADPSPDGTPTKSTKEAHCSWTSSSNGHPMTGSMQPCIIGLNEAQRGPSEALDVKDSGSCITFVNVQAFSPKKTELAEAS